MQMPKPTDADRERFTALVPDGPDVVVKPMFGNLGAFVNGNMFMGLFGSHIGLKLSPADTEALLAIEGAGPYGPPERPMGGWVTLPPAFVGTAEGADWVSRALSHVAGLPPKATRASKAAKAPGGTGGGTGGA
jgi:hypothetical protein